MTDGNFVPGPCSHTLQGVAPRRSEARKRYAARLSTACVRPGDALCALHRNRTLTPSSAAFSPAAKIAAQKKFKKNQNRSCGFSRLRLNHAHRSDGHDPNRRRAISSVGRAPRLHRGCREFESLIAHQIPYSKALFLQGFLLFRALFSPHLVPGQDHCFHCES